MLKLYSFCVSSQSQTVFDHLEMFQTILRFVNMSFVVWMLHGSTIFFLPLLRCCSMAQRSRCPGGRPSVSYENICKLICLMFIDFFKTKTKKLGTQSSATIVCHSNNRVHTNVIFSDHNAESLFFCFFAWQR